VKRYQDRRIRSLVARTARNAFYSRLWREAGADPLSLRTVDDLSRLPIVSKSQMQEADAELPPPSIDRSKLVRIKTTGSTGNPMEIRRHPAEDILLSAFRIRAFADYGLSPWDARVHLHFVADPRPARRRARQYPWWMRLGLFERYALSFAEGIGESFEKTRQLRPAMVGGHAGAIWRMANEVPHKQLRALGLKFVTPSVETVLPLAKQQISQAFGVPAYITYGSTEFNLLAAECPQTGLLHLNELCNYVEVLVDGRPAREGESGQVVATNLHSEIVPFIRFDLGDWATMGPALCPCGAPYRTLQAVQGRVLELFRLPDGAAVHPFHFAVPFLNFHHWLGEYRIIQLRLDLIRIPFTVLHHQDAPADAEALIAAAARAACGRVRVEAQRVEALPPFDKGKNKLFESRLGS
jgi:phenylacetate-CoA ligase